MGAGYRDDGTNDKDRHPYSTPAWPAHIPAHTSHVHIEIPALLPGDEVTVIPGSVTFPGLSGQVGEILDVPPSVTRGYDFLIRFPGNGPILMHAAEVVAA